MDGQQGPTMQYRELSSMLYDSLDGRRLGEELIHVYVWLSPFAVHLKLPQHRSLTILQYKMFLVLKNNNKKRTEYEIRCIISLNHDEYYAYKIL